MKRPGREIGSFSIYGTGFGLLSGLFALLFDNVVIRLTGSNLLDSSKDEIFDKFDSVGDQLARSYDEYEVESESAGPVFQLVMRAAF